MLAQDPIRRSLNPYTYCGNDPVNEAEPTGEVSILAGGLIGGLVGGAFGFAGSAVSQLVSGEKFSMKKALGSAANGAVVGAVKGALVGSGVGIPAAFAADFAAGTVGSALEQKITTGDVDLRKSVTSGLTNAVSNVIYGNGPLKSVKSALARGAGAGAATAAINNISDALAAQTSSDGGGRRRDSSGENTLGTSIPYGKFNDPRTACGSPNPFKFSVSGGRQKTTNTVKTNFYVKPDGNVVPATGYRYTARNVSAIQNAQSGRIAARSEGMYFSFDKMDDAIITQGKLQIPYRPEYRIEFDTLDIIDDISIPKGNWGRADYLEPITKDFGKYGPGKATQVITYSEINSVNGVYKMR